MDTDFRGDIKARGSSQSGEGGFAEVSGKQDLNFVGKVDVSATNGAIGSILLDSEDIIIKSVFEKFFGVKKCKKAPKGIACQYTKNKDSPRSATKKSYPTDLTDDQWELIKDLIPAAGTRGRKRTTDIRGVLNGIFYRTHLVSYNKRKRG